MKAGNFANVVPVADGYTGDVAQRFSIPTVGGATIYQVFGLQSNQLDRVTAPTGTNAFTPFPGSTQWSAVAEHQRGQRHLPAD
jgi:hypothetical protein